MLSQYMLLQTIELTLKREIRTFKSRLKKTVASSNGIATLTRHFTDFQGKHLRPIMTMLAAKAVSPDKSLNQSHFDMAVIVELIHNAALVHDDVLDEANLRRQVKTYNQRWGNEIAVIFGDYLFARLFSHIIKVPSAKLLKNISETSTRVCMGELNHLMKRFNPDGLSEAEYLDIIDNKTASLFALATYLGSSVSTKDTKIINALKSYGRNFGLAYQIMDDYNDIAKSDQTSGKSTGNDLFNGKITLPIIRTAQNSPEPVRRRMKNILSALNNNSRDLLRHKKQLHQLLQENGALDYTHQQAEKYVHSAIKNLKELKNSAYKDILIDLAESVIA